MMSDLDSTAAWAAKNKGSATKLAVTGFCRGGRQTWLYAEHSSNLKAAAAWYGPVNTPDTDIQPHSPLELAAELKCPLLGQYGGQDTSIKVEDVQAAAAKAKAAGKIVEIVVYPDAPHGFNADYRPSYRATDAIEAWNRMLAWFKTYGVA
jgi:carboxymethylenebutenolidase